MKKYPTSLEHIRSYLVSAISLQTETRQTTFKVLFLGSVPHPHQQSFGSLLYKKKKFLLWTLRLITRTRLSRLSLSNVRISPYLRRPQSNWGRLSEWVRIYDWVFVQLKSHSLSTHFHWRVLHFIFRCTDPEF